MLINEIKNDDIVTTEGLFNNKNFKMIYHYGNKPFEIIGDFTPYEKVQIFSNWLSNKIKY